MTTKASRVVKAQSRSVPQPAQTLRTVIDTIYEAHSHTAPNGEESRRLWKAAADLEEPYGATQSAEAPTEVRPVVSLGEIWGGLVEEYGTLRLIYNTLGRHHDTAIGEPVTKDMANDLGAVFSELGRAMERLDAISDDVEELRAAIHKEAQS